MKNYFFKMVIFCLISNVIYSMQPISLDGNSVRNLIAYALRQSANDNYWPSCAKVTLESLCRRESVGSSEEFEARFVGRHTEIEDWGDGRLYEVVICRRRSAFLSANTLKNEGVIVPE